MPNIAFGNMRRPSAREGWGMQGELAKGFVVIYFSLSQKWSAHNINVTLTPETQIARDETVVQTIDVRYFLRRGGRVGGIVFVRFSVWLRKIEGR